MIEHDTVHSCLPGNLCEFVADLKTLGAGPLETIQEEPNSAGKGTATLLATHIHTSNLPDLCKIHTAMRTPKIARASCIGKVCIAAIRVGLAQRNERTLWAHTGNLLRPKRKFV